MPLPPVACFAYNRPEHARRMLESLSAARGAADHPLYVYLDAPKNPEDRPAVEAVRKLAREQTWNPGLHIVEREENMGCAASIIEGVTALCAEYGRAIVIEDDLVLSREFLKYMNLALDRYAESPRVMEISGHTFPLDLSVATDAIFFPFCSSWGWGTWQRAWQQFDPDMTGYEKIRNDPDLRRRFDANGNYPYSRILEDQLAGKLDSWAIRWYLSIFLQDGLTLFPTRSLVANTGFDGTGTHCPHSNRYEVRISEEPVRTFPEEIEISREGMDALAAYYQQFRQTPPPIWKRLIRKVVRFVRTG